MVRPPERSSSLQASTTGSRWAKKTYNPKNSFFNERVQDSSSKSCAGRVSRSPERSPASLPFKIFACVFCIAILPITVPIAASAVCLSIGALVLVLAVALPVIFFCASIALVLAGIKLLITGESSIIRPEVCQNR